MAVNSERYRLLLKFLHHFIAYAVPFRIIFQDGPQHFVRTSTTRKSSKMAKNYVVYFVAIH
jgi:hypothetical protein